MSVGMCVCMYVCMYVCVYKCMYACRYVGMQVCMYMPLPPLTSRRYLPDHPDTTCPIGSFYYYKPEM